MTTPRRKVAAATEAALWALSNGKCYAPGCPFPVVFEVRPGVYRKNAQVAHIYGVRPGAARHRTLPAHQRDSFSNLILLCLAHHAEVDDRRVGANTYPPELLLKWKQDHERENARALAMLGTINEEELTELLTSTFTPPLDRLREIADQLERTGTLNATSVLQLQQAIDLLEQTSFGVDASSASALSFAAEVLGTQEFKTVANTLGNAADVLPHIVADLERSTRRLGDY